MHVYLMIPSVSSFDVSIGSFDTFPQVGPSMKKIVLGTKIRLANN